MCCLHNLKIRNKAIEVYTKEKEQERIDNENTVKKTYNQLFGEYPEPDSVCDKTVMVGEVRLELSKDSFYFSATNVVIPCFFGLNHAVHDLYDLGQLFDGINNGKLKIKE